MREDIPHDSESLTMMTLLRTMLRIVSVEPSLSVKALGEQPSSLRLFPS